MITLETSLYADILDRAIKEYPKYIKEKEKMQEKCKSNPAFGICAMTPEDLTSLIKLILPPNLIFHSIDKVHHRCPLDFYHPTPDSLFQYDISKDAFRVIFGAVGSWNQIGFILLLIHSNLDIQMSVLDYGSPSACHIHNQTEARKIIDKYIK